MSGLGFRVGAEALRRACAFGTPRRPAGRKELPRRALLLSLRRPLAFSPPASRMSGLRGDFTSLPRVLDLELPGVLIPAGAHAGSAGEQRGAGPATGMGPVPDLDQSLVHTIPVRRGGIRRLGAEQPWSPGFAGELPPPHCRRPGDESHARFCGTCFSRLPAPVDAPLWRCRLESLTAQDAFRLAQPAQPDRLAAAPIPRKAPRHPITGAGRLPTRYP